MAKVKSFIEISGTINDVTFYTLKGQKVCRMKGGGFTTEKNKYSDSHARVRENSTEFGHCSKTAKMFRSSMGDFIDNVGYVDQTQRVTQLMTQLKDLDAVSDRGQRRSGIGARTEEGLRLLKTFSFNPHVSLAQACKGKIEADADGKGISITDFDATKMLPFPKGATHCMMEYGIRRFDFGAYTENMIKAPAVWVKPDTRFELLRMEVDHLPEEQGLLLQFMRISYYQEGNGTMWPLYDRNFGTLAVLGAGEF